jgi:predicted regulator of amino acid metabolism with ACT domain
LSRFKKEINKKKITKKLLSLGISIVWKRVEMMREREI